MMNTLIPLVPEVKEMTHRVPGSPGTKRYIKSTKRRGVCPAKVRSAIL
jgi:hypothetical protein